MTVAGLLRGVEVVVWDFDGVLNRNIVDGRFIWADRFEQDLGQPLAPFNARIFGPAFHDVLVGRRDLLDLVGEWVADSSFAGTPQEVVAYWFAADAHLDDVLLELLDRLVVSGLRNVIATNNEARRVDYIEREMGLGARVERIFASGHLGLAKPDPAFFERVRECLAVAPGRLLLIDDNRDNLTAAERLGWRTRFYSVDERDALVAALCLD